MRDALLRLTADYPTGPLYLTENGAAYPDPAPTAGRVPDPDRARYLAGRFVWSLLDDVEWSFGCDLRFGITRVDFTTHQRTGMDSGRWYAQAIAEQRVPPPGV